MKVHMLVKQRGFTLLEILIALSIFALISAGAFTILRSVLQNEVASQKKIDSFHGLSTALSLMENDLRQAIARPIRGEYGDIIPAFTGSYDSFSVTHSGSTNFFSGNKSNLQRSDYSLENDFSESSETRHWVKRSWLVLDRSPRSESSIDLEIPIKDVQLRYQDSKGQWHTRWPRPGVVDDEDYILPAAVDVILEMDDFGAINRLMNIGDGRRAADRGDG